ncbi:MAG TPA: ROK family protein, partial [Clostridiales bacterium]|nr:ROK family protein [Clostridiales bacterium]
MYRVGVDLGGTNIVAGVIDENNKILSKASVKTNAPRKPELIFDDIASVVKKAVADAGITLEDVKSIGVGTPGSVNKETGYIEFANNLDFNQVPAAEMLK